MATLQAEEVKNLVSVTGTSLNANEGQVLEDTFAKLSTIRDLYLRLVQSVPQLEASRWVFEADYECCQHLCFEWRGESSCGSLDWPLLPIQLGYAQKARPSSSESKLQPLCSVTDLSSCLLWIHYLMLTRKNFLKRAASDGHLFVQLCCVFLISDDLYLSPEVQPPLHCLFRRFFKSHYSGHLHLEKVQQPSPFLTFYQELLSQFESTSYGDALFASVVLVPLQQKYSWHYKQMLFTEHSSVISLITINLNQMLVPVEEYLVPSEEEVPLLRIYFKCLQSGLLAKCPLLHTMAIHHLHHYVFSDPPKEYSKDLLGHVLRNQHNVHVLPVLLYESVESTQGIITEEDMPERRKDLIRNLGFDVNDRPST